jgi:hypothetical protein
VLAVSVEDDRYGTYASARYASAHVKNGTFIGYPSGGHVWVGHDAEIWDAVASFLDRLPR